MFHVFDNVIYLFDCQDLCITMCCISFLHISLFCYIHYNEFVFWAGGLTLHNKQYLILSYLWYNQTFKIGGNSFSSKMTLTGEYNLLATL